MLRGSILGYDAPVLRGSILNFSASMDTVLQQQRLHHTLLKGLYRDKVLTDGKVLSEVSEAPK